MTNRAVRGTAAVALAAVAAAGCGDGFDRRPGQAPAREREQVAEATARPAPRSPVLITFRRIRYEGATMRILRVHADGRATIDVPNGGAGGSRRVARVRPQALADIRRLVDRMPWERLSDRESTYLAGSGAYFMLRHGGEEHVAMSDGMSRDLRPLVVRLNGILDGRGRTSHEVLHRYFTP